ncbi:MAG: class I SAM-dependent methyltransferase [Calditrichaeota bacterium]|nr:class I SAM-dependent methyltransferase [Calditrichota bacterium]
MKSEFEVKDQRFTIRRYPVDPDEKLQAWNAADELLIDFIHQRVAEQSRLLIINDQFGFLSALLNKYERTTLIESMSSQKAIEINCTENKCTTPDLIRITNKISGKFDCVLINLPKSIDLLDYYLDLINEQLLPNSLVVAGFMTRYFTSSYIETFSRYFEQIEQSQARKKARLIFATKVKTSRLKQHLKNVSFPFKNNELQISSFPGVFSSNRIDNGTRFLLNHLPEIVVDSTVLDLGCGSGIIALAAWTENPTIRIIATDDSVLAVESAKLNLETIDNQQIICSDDLNEIPEDSIDLILANLPFHSGHATNQQLLQRMILSTKRILKNDAEFRFVVNRHLGLTNFLQSNFRSVTVIAENQSYKIRSCRK